MGVRPGSTPGRSGAAKARTLNSAATRRGATAAAAGDSPADRATGPVRRAAAQFGVNLNEVTPTGAGGRISVADVRKAAGLAPTADASSAARTSSRPVAVDSSPLPAFTASGVDPKALAGLPGPAKAAAAAATTREQAFNIASACAGKNTGEALRILAADPSVENQPLVDYMQANNVRLAEGETILFESPHGGVPMSNTELHGGSW